MADNISDLSVASEEATLAPSGSGSGSGRGDGGGGDSDEKGKKSSHKKDKHQVVGGTLQILTAGKKDKKEKKEKEKKEKETKYSHLGEASSGDEHDGPGGAPKDEGKSPAKSKLRSAKVLFGSAKKDKSKKDVVVTADEASNAAAQTAGPAGGSANDSQQTLTASLSNSGASGKDSKSKKKEGGVGSGVSSAKKSLKLGSVVSSKKSKEKVEKQGGESSSNAAQGGSGSGVGVSGGGSLHTSSATDESNVKSLEVFGVPLDTAVARSKCHDGLKLPLAVRLCIDHIEEHGLMIEGVYRSSGVKSKINKLRTTFNSGGGSSVNLSDYEPAVVASALKQFLRELPDPVLTQALTPHFESVSADPHPQKRIEGMKNLIGKLPDTNKTLLQWIFVHMSHVIEHQKFNKMTLQNVSIVLSPTMNISHRVLNCLFENSHILFEGVVLKKYVAPLTSADKVVLLESPEEIKAEIFKQESLLSDLHLQISRGSASKKTEESIWEQQRIMTQLKRKLRTAPKSNTDTNQSTSKKFEPIDYEEELDFRLQQVTIEEEPKEIPSDHQPKLPPPATQVVSKESTSEVAAIPPKAAVVSAKPSSHSPKDEVDVGDRESAQTATTVNVTTSAPEDDQKFNVGTESAKVEKASNVTVIRLNQGDDKEESKVIDESNGESECHRPAGVEPSTSGAAEAANKKQANLFPLLPKPPSRETKNRALKPNYNNILQPTLVPPTVKPLTSSNEVQELRATDAQQRSQQQVIEKSKSLPRSVSSAMAAEHQEAQESWSEEGGGGGGEAVSESTAESQEVARLQMELLRLQYENEELESLKSELEWRKRSERKEIKVLGEEMATMQTLYQYRTYSVDSSESSSDENTSADNVEQVEQLKKKLQSLVRENQELEEKRMALCDKIQHERSACVQLRVEIKLEQDRIRNKNA